ncbi:BspA family leucine-rich repeat surface protein [Ihubacter sp. mB4P-1]|uniref:BspA family leucine-rich repeat surface protein n=1 Tax=Ihubacter sp. mB4P-1 TaxID=3242370 RepID=UPI003C7D6A93
MKKKIKRWLSIALTASMLLSISVSTFAAEPSSTLKQPADNGIQEDAENQEQNVPDKDPNTAIQDTAVSKGEESAEEATAEKIKKAKATVVVADDTRTVLHEDGTLIINELAENLEVNEEQHGGIIREYPAWDGVDNSYIFEGPTDPLWYDECDLIRQIEVGSLVQPISTAYWFSGCGQASSADLTRLDMSQVISTAFMCEDFGGAADNVILSFGACRTGNLTDTTATFESCGSGAYSVTITGLENWDMSNVESTNSMFAHLGSEAQKVVITGLENWDITKNRNVETMFAGIGGSKEHITMINLAKWNFSEGVNFNGMFASSKNVDFGSIHVPNCNISAMFAAAENIRGKVYLSSKNIDTDLASGDNEFALQTNRTDGALYLVPENKNAYNWAASIVSKYGVNGSISQGHVYLDADNAVGYSVFYDDGTLIVNELIKDSAVNIEKHGSVMGIYAVWDGIDKDYYENVLIQGEGAFSASKIEFGSKISLKSAESLSWIKDIPQARSLDAANLDVSNLTSLDDIFSDFGNLGDDVIISGLETWDTSNVTSACNAFRRLGGAEATSVTISGLGSWDTSKIKNFSGIFADIGDMGSPSMHISGIENWDTSSAENISEAFRNSPCAASDNIILDLSKWDVSKVKDFSYLFCCFGMYANKVDLKGLENWKIKHDAILDSMFASDALALSGEPTVSEFNIGTLTVPGGCSADNMFSAAYNVKGTVKIVGMPVSEYGGEINLAYGANAAGGALYLAPTDDETLAFAEDTVGKYGPTGSVTQGHVYLVKDYIVRTVLYEDGTLIINESGKDQDANGAAYGAVKKEYPAWDGAENDYDFSNGSALWYDDNSSIKSIEIGSKISPINTTRWFYRCRVSNIDVSLLDMSNVTVAVEMFAESSINEIIGLENWNVSNIKDASRLFGWLTIYAKGLKGIENWHFAKGTNLSELFCCSVLQFDSFTVPEGCNVTNMFSNAKSITGNLIINGAQNCAEDDLNGFARYANCGSGALYLVPDDAAYSWAEEMERKYGPNGSISQGHVYLQRMVDFTVSESVMITGTANSTNLTVTDLTVENLGTKAITVSSVQMGNVLNDWTMVAVTTNFATLIKDSRKFSLVIGGFDLSKGMYIGGDRITSDQQKAFKLTGKTGVVSKAITKQQVANLIVTVTAAE